MDAYGDRVCSANLKGDGWRRAHDVVLAILVSTAKQMGCHVGREVHFLFSTQPGLNFATTASDKDRSARSRQGCVPDATIRCPLGGGGGEERPMELKLIRFGPLNYRLNDTRWVEAVDRKAATFEALYRRNLKRFDSKFWDKPVGTPPDAKGPAEQRLAAFGGVKYKIALGQFGEFSGDTHMLVNDMASVGAERHAEEMLLSPQDAKASLVYYTRARLYFATVREQAWLLLEQLRNHVHGGNGQGYAAQPPPPRQQPPQRAREWAADFGGDDPRHGPQQDGPWAYRGHRDEEEGG